MSASVLEKNNLRQRLPFLALLAATCGYVYWTFGKLLKCPSCYLFTDGGDGLKNYFTSAYYVAWSKGLWFTGMNYPYGEHPVYTDNQPAWSLLFKFINLLFPMKQHVVGTLNMLLVISIGVAVIAIFALLREFGLPRWYASITTLPLVLLSPQIERFLGHYALAYVCYIPLFLLLFVRWQKAGASRQRGVFLLLFIVWMGFTHLYFFFIASAFLLAYVIVVWVKHKFRWQRRLTNLMLLVVLSGAAVYLPVKLTDPVTDRPKEVYGMYVFSATFEGTLLPWYDKWPEEWTKKYHIKAPDFESHSYLGIAGVLLTPFILIYAIGNLAIRRRRRQIEETSDLSPGVIAWTGFLVWIMATGWFYMAGGSVLVDLFPVIGQFRSLGRLAWLFYFTNGLFAIWFVYQMIRVLSVRWIKIVVIALASALCVMWYWEAATYANSFLKQIYHSNTILRGEKPYLDLLHANGRTPEDFQAIFQLPSIIIGTENLPVHRGHWEFNNTIQCAWETGLPITNYNMSRTSVSHALSLLQLISTPDIPKVRLGDMDDRPLLLITHVAQILPTEQRLIDLAEPLGEVGHMKLYSLNLKSFTEPPIPDTSSAEVVLHEGFEDRNYAHTLEGHGACEVAIDSVFFVYTDTTGVNLNFSCWVYIASDISTFPAIHVRQYATDGALADDQVYSIHSFDPWQVRGNWVQVTFPLNPKGLNAHYDFSTLARRAVIDEIKITRLQ